MKPLPDIADEAAMLLRGRRSALAAARKEATEALRDAYTLMQSAEWDGLHRFAKEAHDASNRLMTLAAMWSEYA